MSWNETEILAARRRIAKAAQDMLAGKLSYLEGARKIIAAGATARLDEHDADLLPFVGIVSETDALPFGEMREHGRRLRWTPFSRKSTRRKFGPADLANAIAKASSSAFHEDNRSGLTP
jgi:hypothetical protein